MNRRDSNTRPNYTEVQLAFLGRPCRLGRYSTIFVPYNLSRVQRTSPKAEIVQGTLVSGFPSTLHSPTALMRSRAPSSTTS